MKKLLNCSTNLYSFVLVVVAVILFCGFHWAWTSISSVWCRTLPVLIVFVLYDCTLLAMCEYFVRHQENKCWEKYFNIPSCFFLCFSALAFVLAIYAWVNFWLFIGTIILAVIFFLIGILIVWIYDEAMFGRY